MGVPLSARALRTLIARLASSAAIVFALSFVLFGVLSSLPGDPVDLLVTSNPNVKPEDIARLKKLRGLDQPWPVQWWRWLVGHHEPLDPPRAPAGQIVATELGAHGGVVVEVRGAKREYRAPGVYDEPFVVRDDASGLEDVGVDEVFVSPAIPIIDEDDGAPHLDEIERQLGGSTESPAAIGRASESDMIAGARSAGRAFGIRAPHVVEAGAHGDVLIANACGASTTAGLSIVSGPGVVDGSGVRAHFDGAGRSAIVFECANGDVRARGAVIVEHGVVVDPARFHRGAIFALIGDFDALGFSSTYKRPVIELLRDRISNTLLLMIPAFVIAVVAAVVLALVAARRRGSIVDRIVVASSIVSVSVPSFWVGLMGIVVFAAKLRVLPAGGIDSPGDESFGDVVMHMILPVAVLAFAYAGPFVRYARAGLLEAMPADYVRTARAKGLRRRAVVVRHALPNALIPLFAVVALQAPQMFAGALLTETVFAWPGIGRLQYESIINNDSYVAIVVFLISASLVLIANLVADVLYTVVDPRLRRR